MADENVHNKQGTALTVLLGVALGVLVLACLCDGRIFGDWAIHTYYPWRDRAVGIELEHLPYPPPTYLSLVAGRVGASYGFVIPLGDDAVMLIGNRKSISNPSCLP